MIFLFLTFFSPQSHLNITPHRDIHVRDFVRHGNVTLIVTYPISGSSADISIIFLFLTYFWTTKSS